jgi:hypothetical protein
MQLYKNMLFYNTLHGFRMRLQPYQMPINDDIGMHIGQFPTADGLFARERLAYFD